MTATIPRREVSRALSQVAQSTVPEVLARFRNSRPSATHRIGITGPPGAGKSSLINALAGHRIANTTTETVAVLAIDPTSARNGGAILGDRIRMQSISDLPGLFIRSMPSGTNRNGLCDNVVDLLGVLEEFGFSETILETVGIGQSEIDIRELVDTLVLAVPPDSGDFVQAMKAGSMEVADIIAVTKADKPEAERMAAEISSVLRIVNLHNAGRHPTIVLTASDGTGLETLSNEIDTCRERRRYNIDAEETQALRRAYHLRSLMMRKIDELLSVAPDITRSGLDESYARLVRALARTLDETTPEASTTD